MTITSSMLGNKDNGQTWKDFSQDYDLKVLSVTSFPKRRQQIMREVTPGVVADLGCGPLGLILRDICRLPETFAIGTDFCYEMLVESSRHTRDCDVAYVLADNRSLPFQSQSLDTIVSVNSFLPETRRDVNLIFGEVARTLKKGGRLVAMLPSFEMSLIARDYWKMPIELDLDNHREWDTLGWQCFYTLSDIDQLIERHSFCHYRVEKISFSSHEEINHFRLVYKDTAKNIPIERLIEAPLFEHLLIANR
jgi:ubiquinone/menaquinone biosynthesis C-methylase UbiE